MWVKIVLLNGELPCQILKLKRKPPKLNCYKTKLTIYYRRSNSSMLLNLNNLKLKNISVFCCMDEPKVKHATSVRVSAAPMLLLSWLTAYADIL